MALTFGSSLTLDLLITLSLDTWFCPSFVVFQLYHQVSEVPSDPPCVLGKHCMLRTWEVSFILLGFSSRSSRSLHGLNTGGPAVPHLKAFTYRERRVLRGGWCFLGAPSRRWSSLGCRQHPGSILPTVLPCPQPSWAPRSMGKDWEWVGTALLSGLPDILIVS